MSRKASQFRIAPISAAAPGPLYRQIVEGVKREISEGRLAPGAPLPSFRTLAERLMVSLITVKRAYEELEHEGIIFRKQGLGTFVSDNGAARSRQAKRREAERLLERAVREGAEAGMGEREILRLARRLVREQKEDRDRE